MDNPWMTIPASDYEGHMGSPEVDQLAFLNRIFQDALSQGNSRSVAYLGAATGNGLEHIQPDVTQSLDIIDINPAYLQIVQRRYQQRLPQMRLIAADLNEFEGDNHCYSLIFAGLLFEYLAPGPLLGKICHWLEDEGTLVVVLQLESQQMNKISHTAYSSLERLAPLMTLISVEAFQRIAQDNGLNELDGNVVTLPSGKRFYVGRYGRASD